VVVTWKCKFIHNMYIQQHCAWVVCILAKWSISPKLILVAWSDWEYFYTHLEGMLNHCQVTPRPKCSSTHLYTWVEMGTVRVQYLVQGHENVSSLGLNSRHLIWSQTHLTWSHCASTVHTITLLEIIENTYRYKQLITITRHDLQFCSLRSRREWVPARTSVPNASAKSHSGREKNGEESCWIPACSKTMLFWIVSSPANYYFHWLRAVTPQSNVNRYLSQGRTSVRRDATLRYCHDINQNGEDEGKYWEGIEFAKYTERKGDYSERRTRKGSCGINFRERRFGYTTNWFRKKFDLYDLCFGEHRFAIC